MSLDTSAATVTLNALTVAFDRGVKLATPLHRELAMEVPSSGLSEDYAMLGNVPSIREWLGERVFSELRAAKWNITNKEWEGSVMINKTDIKDDRLGLYKPVMEQLGRRAANHPTKLLFDLINGAETGACFDGQYFFDTDHSWGDSGDQDNDLTYDVVSTTAVTPAEFKAAYNQAVGAMAAFVDDQGEYLNDSVFQPSRSLVVVVPFALEQAALDALSVRLLSTGGDNAVIDRPKIIPCVALDSDVKFDVYRVDEPIKPYIFQAREPLSRQRKGDSDAETKLIKFMSYARYNMGYGAWWTAVRTTLS